MYSEMEKIEFDDFSVERIVDRDLWKITWFRKRFFYYDTALRKVGFNVLVRFKEMKVSGFALFDICRFCLVNYGEEVRLKKEVFSRRAKCLNCGKYQDDPLDFSSCVKGKSGYIKLDIDKGG